MKHAWIAGLVSLLLVAAACKSESGDAPNETAGAESGDTGSKTVEPSTATPGVGGDQPVAPRLDTEKAQAMLTAAAAEGKKADGDCARIIEAVNTAAAAVGPTTEENQQAFLYAAICAEKLKNYPVMLWAAQALAGANPESLKLGIIPRALMHLDRPDKALAALKAINETYPNAPGVMFAAMLLATDQRAFGKVLELADPTIKALVKSPFKGVAWQVEVMRARALLTAAKWDAVGAALGRAAKLGAPPPVLQTIRKQLIPVKKTRVYVDPEVPDVIYLGAYHLYGKAKSVGHMFTMNIANLTGEDQSMKVELEIPGITDRITRTVNMLAGGFEKVVLSPPLKSDFKPAAQQAERVAQVRVLIKLDSGKVVYDESIGTKLFPRDELPLRDLSVLLPAWITPQAPEVESLLTAAKKRAPGGNLSGKLGPTVPQMKAIYEELKARGMSYVLVTNFGLSPNQHVRLPADTIKSTNALCLDGTVLFATLAEKLGLRPVLVRVPGHIFFGWYAEKADNAPPGTIFFVETTMVGSHGFDQAVQAGKVQFLQQKKLGGFESGQAELIDVMQLRGAGITPQPWG